MPARPGEDLLVTLYADIHYYFNTPTPRPMHHRFDKTSYVYLYRDNNAKRARLEVANNAGKPEQDAFYGYLDRAHLTMSHKHPTLCTVTVDKQLDSPGDLPPIEESHWRLPSTDPRDEGKYHFRIHTLDLYFWTDENARSFVDAMEKLLERDQLAILDGPRALPEHEAMMSSVVQNLENVAIDDPAYHNGQTRSSRTTSTVASPAPRIPSQSQQAQREKSPESAHSPEKFTPLAYNPAAPPAPEPIKHREKTPPPPETEGGTGLAAAVHNDHFSAYGPSPSHSQSSYVSPPPQPQSPQAYPFPPQHQIANSAYTSPPPSSGFANPSPYPQSHRASSVSSYSSLPPPPPPPQQAAKIQGTGTQQLQQHHNSSSPPPKDTNYPYGPGAPPPESPATEILGNSYMGAAPPLQHLQPQYADYLQSHPPQHQQQRPPGGYSNYQYSQQPHNQPGPQSPGHPHDIHSQVYRPTEQEAGNHGGRHRPSNANSSQQPGRLEQGAEKVEKGVNRFLRKLEKKIG